jgi:uncharacterized membrane protein
MFINLLLLLACALIAIAAVPLMLKLVPPNPIYGLSTNKTRDRPEAWFEVNRVAGTALVVAAGLAAILLMMNSGRSWWAQLLIFLIPVGAAVGAAIFYERKQA